MKNIRFIQDGDRFIAIVTPIKEFQEEINTIKSIFSGTPIDGLKMAEKYQYRETEEKNGLDKMLETYNRDMNWYRGEFRKGIKKQIQVYQNMDSLYQDNKNNAAYIDAVIDELRALQNKPVEQLRVVLLVMTNIAGPVIGFCKQQTGQVQMTNEEFLNLQQKELLIDIIERGVIKNLRDRRDGN